MELKMQIGESYLEFCNRVLSNYKQYGFATARDCFRELTGIDMFDNARKHRSGLKNIQKAYDSGYYKKFVGDVVEVNKEELNSFYKSDEQVEVEDKEFLLKSNQQLRKQLQTANDKLRLFRAEQRTNHRTDVIWDKFLEDFNNIKPLEIAPPVIKTYNKVAVLNVADVHVGMKFENELNVYNKDIVKERFRILTQKTIEKLTPDTKLIVLQLGDEISGNIHVSTRINSDLNVVEQVKLFTECMLGMLKSFCENFVEVEYYSVHGNHSRVTPSKEESLEKENFTAFSDWYIREAMRDTKHFKFPQNRFYGIAEFKVFDKTIVGLHGHQTGFDSVTKVAHTLGYIPSQTNVGHWHTFHNKDFGRTRVIGNPSMCGVDSYANDKLLYGVPHQLLEVFYENGDKDTKEIYFNKAD